MFSSKSLAKTVNMTVPEIQAWLRNPRYLLASTDTGHESLRRLAQGDHLWDDTFARKVDNFNNRHLLSSALFGSEIGGSGWSKRAIALRNWGHDPSQEDSPAYSADYKWLKSHAGAAERRNTRIKNPIAIIGFTSDGRIPGLDSFYRKRNPDTTIASTSVPLSSLDGARRATVEIGVLHPNQTVPISSAGQRVARTFVAEIHKGMGERLRGDMPGSAYQLAPALEHAVGSRYDQFDRKPNPGIGPWILPVAQLIVSASGLYFSITSLSDLVVEGRSRRGGRASSLEAPEDMLQAQSQLQTQSQ
jgi:hypothetical protein